MATTNQRVAVVTGASRGIGKGVAIELGRLGFTVYATGRSSRVSGITTERDMPVDEEVTVDATAEAVTAAGGHGVGIRCDHSNDGEFDAIIEEISSTVGRLDVLVYSAFQTPPNMDTAQFRAPFWTQDGAMWDSVHGVGLRSAYLACCAAAPLMISTATQSSKSHASLPLIVLISSFGGRSFVFNVAYGVQKAATDRLALDMHWQLQKHGVCTVSLYPGVVRTEGNLEMQRRGKWADASGGIDLTCGESPVYTGRAVAALCSLDAEQLCRRSGQVQVVAELAKELGFRDADGQQTPSIRSLKFILPNFVFPQIEAESGAAIPSWIRNYVPDWLIPWNIFSSAPPPTQIDP